MEQSRWLDRWEIGKDRPGIRLSENLFRYEAVRDATRVDMLKDSRTHTPGISSDEWPPRWVVTLVEGCRTLLLTDVMRVMLAICSSKQTKLTRAAVRKRPFGAELH